VHTDEPLVQLMYPIRHELLFGEHTVLLAHAVHVPLSHTWLVPHGVPFGTFVAFWHVDAPLEHDVVPDWHTLPPGLHAAFAVQFWHVPVLSQTWLVPHDVPGGALASVSLHEIPPSTHNALPRWHPLLSGTHGAPGVHAPQWPVLQ
jgi:hypothetical protein